MSRIKNLELAIDLCKIRQSRRALAGKGYCHPLSLQITIDLIADLAPPARIMLGTQAIDGNLETVLEKAVELINQHCS